MIAAPAVCFGYQNRGAECPTPHAIAYVSRCEQVACARCMEAARTLCRARLSWACLGCGAPSRTEAELLAHWRPIAGAA